MRGDEDEGEDEDEDEDEEGGGGDGGWYSLLYRQYSTTQYTESWAVIEGGQR